MAQCFFLSFSLFFFSFLSFIEKIKLVYFLQSRACFFRRSCYNVSTNLNGGASQWLTRLLPLAYLAVLAPITALLRRSARVMIATSSIPMFVSTAALALITALLKLSSRNKVHNPAGSGLRDFFIPRKGLPFACPEERGEKEIFFLPPCTIFYIILN